MAEATACLYLEHVVCHRGLLESNASGEGPFFPTAFWHDLLRLIKPDAAMLTTDHLETDGQTERVNHVVQYITLSFDDDSPRD